jgi:ribosomal protein L35AE/L33A
MARHLQINPVKPRVQFQADGVGREFPFPFEIFADANLEVYLDNERLASGFTVQGIGQPDGGNVIFASPPPAGASVTLRRRLNTFVSNDELDYLSAAVQQLEAEIERTVRLAPADVDAKTILPSVAERAGRAIAFDTNGDLTAVLPNDLLQNGQNGYRSLDDIPEGIEVRRFSAAEKAKLASVENGAQSNAPVVSPQEKALANEPAVRSFSPKDVADMVAIHAPVYDHAVASVHGRTGAVVAQAGDYTADQIAETAERVVMTAAERAKLVGVEAGAGPNPPRVTSAEKNNGTSTVVRGFAPIDVRDMVMALAPPAPVTSVAGRTGAVALTKADVGLAAVTDDAQLRADLVYPTKAAPASGDKLVIKDQSDGQPKLIDWNQLPSGSVTVSSVHGRVGAIVGQSGDYTADQITDTAAKVLMTAAERTKLGAVAAGAQVNPTRITAAEKAAGTSVTVRGFAPVDVRDMVTAFAPSAAVTSVAGRVGAVTLSKEDVGLGNVSNDAQIRADLLYTAKTAPAAGDKLVIRDQADGLPKIIDWNQLPTGSVTAVHGRTGAVVAKIGDYTAEQITDTANKVVMTAAERAKLGAVEAGAQANPPSISAAEKAAPLATTALRLFSPKDIAELMAAVAAANVRSVDGGTADTVFAAA